MMSVTLIILSSLPSKSRISSSLLSRDFRLASTQAIQQALLTSVRSSQKHCHTRNLLQNLPVPLHLLRRKENSLEQLAKSALLRDPLLSRSLKSLRISTRVQPFSQLLILMSVCCMILNEHRHLIPTKPVPCVVSLGTPSMTVPYLMISPSSNNTLSSASSMLHALFGIVTHMVQRPSRLQLVSTILLLVLLLMMMKSP